MKNGKERAVYLKDTRTGNELPLSFGLINKHLYSNFNLKTWAVYMSKMCNSNIKYPIMDIEKFHLEIIKKHDGFKKNDFRTIFLKD
jgi:hypothetical protein